MHLFLIFASFVNVTFQLLHTLVYARVYIHDFLYDSPRFLMVRKIEMDRDESWRKVEIFMSLRFQ